MIVATAVAPLPPIYYLYGIRVPGHHAEHSERIGSAPREVGLSRSTLIATKPAFRAAAARADARSRGLRPARSSNPPDSRPYDAPALEGGRVERDSVGDVVRASGAPRYDLSVDDSP